MTEEQFEKQLTDFAKQVFRAERKAQIVHGVGWIDRASEKTAKMLLKLLRQMGEEANKQDGKIAS